MKKVIDTKEKGGMQRMQMQIKRDGTVLVISLTGELDQHSADDTRRKIDGALLSHVSRYVIFDFSGLTFMDSSGIGMLMGRNKNVETLGGTAWIVCNREVFKLLEMSGVFKYIKRADSVREITESLRGDA